MQRAVTASPRFLYAVGIGMCALLMVLVGAEIERLLYQNYIQQLKLDATVELIEVREDIEEDIFDARLILRGLEAAIQQNPDMTEAEFADLASDLKAGRGDIRNIAAAPGMVVRHVYPLEGNEAALGLDYRSHAEQGKGAKRAAESGVPAISAPVDLVQGGKGIVLRSPVSVSSGPAGRNEFWGVVAVVLDYDAFVAGIGLDALEDRYDVLIRSTGRPGEAPRHVIGLPAVEGREPLILDFDLPYGEWQLLATTDGGWPAHTPSYMGHRLVMIAVAGAVLASLSYMAYLSETRRRAQNRLLDALDAIDDGFVIFDENDRLVMANARYKSMYDKMSELMVPGQKFETLIREGMRRHQQIVPEGQEEALIRERLMGYNTAVTEVQQRFHDGRVIRATDRRMRDGGRVGLRVDLTALEDARQRAEEASRAKTDFIGTLSHELRTPLTVILGNVRLVRNLRRFQAGKRLLFTLNEDPSNAERVRRDLEALFDSASEMMGKVERSGEHLLTLINEMLDFAKIESGTAHVEIETHDIGDIVEPITDQMAHEAARKGLEFRVSSSGGVVVADEVRARQILFNLVGNALKFTDTGHIAINVTASDEFVTFEVSDTGSGIPADALDLIFEAFQQVDNSAERKASGTGLGLAISKKLALAQGGDLTVRSELGRGTTFTLTLRGPVRASKVA